ncbi:hypothetical protein [Caulobacter sp. 602-1]|uniref:hypothetical protein n=1 Tax=Caulobacter sp. 602-1 TaxID=2492472 RepID=UPI000F63739C|nr:hypothetical protein [Caulobacter sp. 602-1]RRN62910.1 hypothetical protein EIK80_20410 [Caulobacter sp. 602-1]
MAHSSLALSASHAGDGDVQTRLEVARGAIEGRFLEVGEVLSHVVDGTSALITALDLMREGLEGQEVAAATRQLSQASEQLRELPAALHARRDRLGCLVSAGDALTVCIEDMRQHLAYLRVFGVNIKITSGGIAAAGPEFAIFAQEICDCIELGRTQLDTFRNDLSSMDGALRAALGHEDELRRRCDGLLPAVPDALVGQTAAIADHQAKIAQITARVGELVRDVRKKIGSALAALQIGDITRQRIEHVQHGLALLRDSAPANALPAEARARLDAFVHRLLAAQLHATIDDFHRDVSRIGQSVGAIAGDASEILRLRDHAQGGSSNGEASFLRGLETSVGEAFALVDDIEAGARQAADVSRSAANSARDLAAQIEAIQNMRADVQMMALNTTLKCSRIGETGKPLGVIAVELRAHAGHLETSAARTLTALQSLSASADAEPQADGQDGATSAALALRDAVGRIRKTGDAVEGGLVDAARQGDEVVDMLRRAAARFDFQRQVGDHLDQAAAELESLSGDVRVDDLMGALSPLLADLARSYTMAQEREVHAALTAGLDVAAIEAPAEAETVEDDDLLF